MVCFEAARSEQCSTRLVRAGGPHQGDELVRGGGAQPDLGVGPVRRVPASTRRAVGKQTEGGREASLGSETKQSMGGEMRGACEPRWDLGVCEASWECEAEWVSSAQVRWSDSCESRARHSETLIMLRL